MNTLFNIGYSVMKKILAVTFLVTSFSTQAGDVVSSNMLSAHNTWRSEVGSPALKWSADLQAKAQTWADQLKGKGCGMKHSGPGENLYWASAQKSASGKDADGNWIWKNSLQAVSDKKVVDSWGSEKQWYDYASNSCNAPAGKACGHYTQVVWKETTEVGCANAVCDDFSQVWVCNYAPAGNMQGQKPY
jgi:pathogenesis-related protein 1